MARPGQSIVIAKRRGQSVPSCYTNSADGYLPEDCGRCKNHVEYEYDGVLRQANIIACPTQYVQPVSDRNQRIL